MKTEKLSPKEMLDWLSLEIAKIQEDYLKNRKKVNHKFTNDDAFDHVVKIIDILVTSLHKLEELPNEKRTQ